MTTSKAAVFLFVMLAFPLGYALAQQDATVQDKDIKVVDFAEMEYPSLALMAHVEGVVVVKATLDEQGRVTDTVAVSGSEQLIPNCLSNAKKWRFEPNARKMVILIYMFRTDGVCHRNQISSHAIFNRPNILSITGCTGVTYVNELSR